MWLVRYRLIDSERLKFHGICDCMRIFIYTICFDSDMRWSELVAEVEQRHVKVEVCGGVPAKFANNLTLSKMCEVRGIRFRDCVHESFLGSSIYRPDTGLAQSITDRLFW
jgi:hypothetical protein